MHRFKVAGMTCGHCASSVRKAVQSVDPRSEISVDLARGEITVRSAADGGLIAQAIRSAGYENQKIAARGPAEG